MSQQIENAKNIGKARPAIFGALARATKRALIILLLFSIFGAAFWLWYVRERIADLQLEETIKEETGKVEKKLDERSDKIETKLDRIEGKLDRLLYLLEPRLMDGMTPVE